MGKCLKHVYIQVHMVVKTIKIKYVIILSVLKIWLTISLLYIQNDRRTCYQYAQSQPLQLMARTTSSNNTNRGYLTTALQVS
jgi:hypothetical protein